ncbi:HNH endonuclease signature motif containing protein [Amycolatopsis sp. NPDC050768]|uniref:HNH endonuclease signature motif containing protein n=1 Tax=Amycolatopsis sp. NPDC050768 TaxID=3154839 RepID=UPI0033C1984C
MTLGDLTSREAVIEAIRQCADVGREQFVHDHGFGPARDFLLEFEGRYYDSKAIAGVAYGIQHPDRSTLLAAKFNGGAAGAARRLKALGFTVVTAAQLSPPALGDEYPNRTAIQAAYGGNGVAGIIRFPGEAVVNAFSDETGPYADEPPDAVNPFEYRGDGRRGHQRLVRGNKMLDQARRGHEAVRFWYRPAGEAFRFVTWAAVLDRAQVWALDDDTQVRLEYSFLVMAIPDPDPTTWPRQVLDRINDLEIRDDPLPPPTSPSADGAVKRATYKDYVQGLADLTVDDQQHPSPTKKARNHYQRNRKARDAVLLRAANKCENDRCTGMPSDTTADGSAILEVDHVDDLALGGPDHPSGMIALCPNCHAAKTRGRRRATLTRHLRVRAAALHQRALDRTIS